jgi:uncharacterized protein (TIGR00251 family)
MSTWFQWSKTDLVLNVRIQPNGRSDEFIGPYGEDQLKLKLNAPPVDGKANAHLIAFLSDIFGVPKRQVEIISGESSRSKRVRILAPETLPSTIAVFAPLIASRPIQRRP